MKTQKLFLVVLVFVSFFVSDAIAEMQFGAMFRPGIAHLGGENSFGLGVGAMLKSSNTEGYWQISKILQVDGSFYQNKLEFIAIGAGMRMFDCNVFHLDFRGGMIAVRDGQDNKSWPDPERLKKRTSPFMDIGFGLEHERLEYWHWISIGFSARFFPDYRNLDGFIPKPVLIASLEYIWDI